MEDWRRGGVGQRAAVADIARARARAQGPAETDDSGTDPALVARAQTVFQKFEALVGAARTYAEDHPARERFMTALVTALEEFQSRHEDLVFDLDARSLSVEGEVVFETNRTDANLWFPLFAEGVRTVELAPGIDGKELTILVELLSELRESSGEDNEEQEDDAVTMLWEADFEYLTFIAVDGFIEGGEDVESGRVDALQQMIEASTVKHHTVADDSGPTEDRATKTTTVAITAADVQLLRQENLTTLDEMPEATTDHGDVVRLDLDRSHDFIAGCTDEPTVVERYVAALLRSLEVLSRTGEDGPILDQLRDLFGAVVADGRYVRARMMVEQVVESARDERGAAFDWRARVERHVITAAVLQELLATVDDIAKEDADEVVWLVGNLSSWAAPTVIGAISRLGDESRRQKLIEVAAGWGDASQAALTEVIPHANEDAALGLVRLALRIGGVGLADSVRAALGHHASSVRTNGLRAVLQHGDDATCEAAAVDAVVDADPTLRQLASQYIARYGVVRARPAIERFLAGDRASNLDSIERTQLYVALAAAGGRADWFMTKLGQRNLLGLAAGDSERIAAAAALAHLRHEPARPLLEKLAKGRLTRSEVREACGAALSDLDRPAPSVERRKRQRPTTATEFVQPEGDRDPRPDPPRRPSQPTEMLATASPAPAPQKIRFKPPTRQPAPEPEPAPPPEPEPAPVVEMDAEPPPAPEPDPIPDPIPDPVPEPPEPAESASEREKRQSEIDDLLGAYLGPESEPAPEPEPAEPTPVPSELEALLADYVKDDES